MKRLIVISLILAISLGRIASALPREWGEAPMLTDKVASGLLPPVEERLPLTPKVLTRERNEIPPGDLDLEIGQFGGTLRTVRSAPDWNPDVFIMNNEPLLSAPGILGEGIQGNILQGFEVSEGGKVFTFYMRKGLRWSDGVLVTTEDVLFAYEDVLLNEKLAPIFPVWLRSGNRADGEKLTLEILDRYTFRISFPEPYGGFPEQLAITFWRGYTELLKPKHYLKNFHIRYTPLEELKPLLQEEALAPDEWWTLFHLRDIFNWELTTRRAVGFPVLNPWMIVKATPTTFFYERNPYYFKVDAQGNQLPYLDKIRCDLVIDAGMATMKVLAGEIDFLRTYATLESLVLYKENEARGGYQVALLDMHVAPTAIRLNLTYPDRLWREVARDVRFRKALNMAINREEIIDAIYFGLAELPKAVPSIFDPATANRLLDEMGLDKRDVRGYRLGPDGRTLIIPFEVAMHAADIVPVTELVIEHWREVGIKATLRTISSALYGTRHEANELKADVLWYTEPKVWWKILWDYPPYSWGMLWHLWDITEGRGGEEPPELIKRFVDLIEQLIIVSPEKRPDTIKELRRLMYENIFVMTIAEGGRQPLIVSARLGNVPHRGFAIAANFAAEQLFFRQ